jgi:hypothetical protein
MSARYAASLVRDRTQRRASMTELASGVSPQEAALVKCGSVEAFSKNVKRILWTLPPATRGQREATATGKRILREYAPSHPSRFPLPRPSRLQSHAPDRSGQTHRRWTA